MIKWWCKNLVTSISRFKINLIFAKAFCFMNCIYLNGNLITVSSVPICVNNHDYVMITTGLTYTLFLHFTSEVPGCVFYVRLDRLTIHISVISRWLILERLVLEPLHSTSTSTLTPVPALCGSTLSTAEVLPAVSTIHTEEPQYTCIFIP